MKLAVIFDMDGVLIDSVQLNWQAYNQVLEPYGVHVGPEDLHLYAGRNIKDIVEILDQTYSTSIDFEAFDRDANAIKDEIFKDVKPKEGVEQLLKSLKEAAVPVAVGTSTWHDIAMRRLQTAGIYDYFDVVVAGEDVTHHKPHPEVYLRAAEELVALPEYCVVVEDAPVGVEAAHAAGMRVVAVRTSYVPSENIGSADLTTPSLIGVSVKMLADLL